MRGFGRQSAASQRQADRRKQEDEAPRLAAEVPDLLSLRLVVEEKSSATTVGNPGHIRRIVVTSAPALFIIPCGDANCIEGGHDVTHEVMRALRGGQTGFFGSDDCRGALGSATCSRVLHFHGVAEYRPA